MMLDNVPEKHGDMVHDGKGQADDESNDTQEQRNTDSAPMEQVQVHFVMCLTVGETFLLHLVTNHSSFIILIYSVMLSSCNYLLYYMIATMKQLLPMNTTMFIILLTIVVFKCIKMNYNFISYCRSR